MSPEFRVYCSMDQRMPLSQVPAHAQRAEALGYDGLCVPEAVHDGLNAATLALHATTRLRVATSVLVAFPRSPMTTAVAAWDLQEMSGGRFELGLGSQVRGNITRRYGVEWTPPAPRMREYVGALKAIFRCWQDGGELCFEGDHYQLTRMQPFFKPDPLEHPAPAIYLGGIGPAMTTVAGEVSDGLMTHPTNTAPRYIREVVTPRLERGAERSGRDPTEVALMVGPLTATGATPADVAREREDVRQMLTFLYSTPSYWPSLEIFGWQERGEHLHQLTREGRWDDMKNVIDDAMLDTFSPSGTYAEIADILAEWYGDLTDWILFPIPDDPARDPDAAKVLDQLRTGS